MRQGRSEQIRLDRAEVNDDDLRHLDGLESKLVRVNLSRARITDTGLARLCGMRQSSNSYAWPVRWSPMPELEHLPELSHLRFLHLIDMPITDAGLDRLHGMESLESVYLDGTKITDSGIGRLVTALPRIHIHVDDHHHRLDPHGAEHTH